MRALTNQIADIFSPIMNDNDIALINRSVTDYNDKDMYGYLTPLLRKKPSVLILHVGTNDVVTKTSDEKLNEILDLKKDVENAVPGIHVVISRMIIRSDNRKAYTVLGNVNTKLVKLGVTLLDHSNILCSDLGRKGIHLNDVGVKKLALNIISLIRRRCDLIENLTPS